MPEMKDSGIEWIGLIPSDWSVEKGKYHFAYKKIIPGVQSSKYERLSLTLKGVIPIECYWICIFWGLLKDSYSLGIVNSFLPRFRVCCV